MKLSQPAFNISHQLNKHACPLPKDANASGPACQRRKNVFLDLHIFQNLAEKKFYLQGITDACVKKAVLEICFEKNTKELVAGPYKNICTIAVHC